MKRIVKIIIIIAVTVLSATVGSFACYVAISSIQLKKPYESTSIDELKYYSSFFDDVEMESCNFEWKASVIFFGDILESQICGRADLTDEYFARITQDYNWQNGTTPDRDYSETEGTEILTEFLHSNEWYISDDFGGGYAPWVYLSKEEKALYFYEIIG